MSAHYHPPAGMPLSVFNSKYARAKADGSLQTYPERAAEMIDGNFLLEPDLPSLVKSRKGRRNEARRLAQAGVMPLSGRHLQQGDDTQPSRHGELFTNCSTAATAAAELELLLKGSGCSTEVSSHFGVDWRKIPRTSFRISNTHADVKRRGEDPPWGLQSAPYDYALVSGQFERPINYAPGYDVVDPTELGSDLFFSDQLRISPNKYAVYVLPDTVEGWAWPALIWEAYIREGRSDDHVVFDFSLIRPNGAPIRGQQLRPACGPFPLMEQYANAYIVARMWDETQPAAAAPLLGMWVRHYLSQAVAFGGVRRSAKLTGMHWRDPAILYFITAKRGGRLVADGSHYGPARGPGESVLWSANNSVLVDKAFWFALDHAKSRHHKWAVRVFELATECAYKDGTGEPGLINADQLAFVRPNTDEAVYFCDDVVRRIAKSECPVLMRIMREAVKETFRSVHWVVPNPCAEVPLWVGGGYCNIADLCLANTRTVADAIRAGELTVEALIRVNRMDFMYAAETARTNRVGVSLTGLHEFIWEQWGVSALDLIRSPESKVAKRVSKFLLELSRATQAHAKWYAELLGMAVPHTVLIVKPSGTIGKAMDCTEGVHVSAHLYYLRNMQFKIEDPEVERFEARGYPVRRNIEAQYPGHCIVGFPTSTRAARLMGPHAISAQDMQLADHFKWVQFIEQNWLDRAGDSPMGGQVSYTANYNPADLTLEQYRAVIREHMPRVRAISVLPATDPTQSGYVYLPEEPLTRVAYDALMARIDQVDVVPLTDRDVACGTGGCPTENNLR